MTYHAQLIVTDYPSKDSVGGLAIFNNNKPSRVLVTSQLLDRAGKMGILKALNGDNSEPFLSGDRLEAHSDTQFYQICAQMADRCGLHNLFDVRSLSQ